MLLAYLKDMSFEEILGIFQPITYLFGLVAVGILAFVVYKIWRKTGLKRLFAYMDEKGETEGAKREYLKKFFTNETWGELAKHKRTCCLCGKKYSLKVERENERGDVVEEWGDFHCPRCGFRVALGKKIDYLRYFELDRIPKGAKKEAKYREDFERLCNLNDFYKPFVDCSPDSPDKNITITINLS